MQEFFDDKSLRSDLNESETLEDENLPIDLNKLERLERDIITKENIFVKTGKGNDADMIRWIQEKIEEEVKCYSNQ